MSPDASRAPAGWRRPLAAGGALACALAIGFGAYAVHGLEGEAQSRLHTAVAHLFAHGLALAVFAPSAPGRAGGMALLAWAAGSVLFCGSLAISAFRGGTAPLAPAGGVLFIAGWALLAAALLRRA